jgi:hypothetical protein
MTSSWFGWRWKACDLPGRNVASTVMIRAAPSAGELTAANVPQSCSSRRMSSAALNVTASSRSP